MPDFVIAGLIILFYTGLGFLAWKKEFIPTRGRVTLLEYQRGIFFHEGMPQGDADPGTHEVINGVDKIVYCDMRPQTITGNSIFATRDGAPISFGFTFVVQIRSPKLTIYSSVNHIQMATTIVVSKARRTINSVSAPELATARTEVEHSILQEADAASRKMGMAINSFALAGLQQMQAERTAGFSTPQNQIN